MTENQIPFMEQSFSLPVVLGDGLDGQLRVVDLATLPHLLVAGAAMQGKTAFLRTLIMSLIWKKDPEDLKLVLLGDPNAPGKFKPFEMLKNKYLASLPDGGSESGKKEGSVVTDIYRSEKMLSALCLEMEKRYELFQKAGTWEIKSYNSMLESGKISSGDGHCHLPYIVCVCDEYAALVLRTYRALQDKMRKTIITLAQKGRAVGIHMVISTQRPCVDVITGVVKANFPARAAFRVASGADSRVILDCPGAEKLTGKGDMLFSTGLDCERVKVPYYPEDEMEDEIRKLAGDRMDDAPYYLPSVPEAYEMKLLDDPLYDTAKSIVIKAKSCSLRVLQRKLLVGYIHACRLVDMLKADGVIDDVADSDGNYPLREK